MDFIAVGEMLIDFLPGEEPGSYVRNAGGAPANAAIAVARHGISSGIYCKLGNDDFGRFLLGTLRENGVAPLAERLCDSATTTMAFVTLSENNERSFTFARKPGADMMLRADEIREEELRSCAVLQAGSCSLSAGEAREATRFALRRAHELNKLVSFDINYRSLMWEDQESCIREVRDILPCVDLLKLSEEETDFLGGREGIFSAMKKYDLAAVVLTLGGEGAELFFEGKSELFPGCRLGETRDTTGAGDAFWGAFLARLLKRGVRSREALSEELLREAVQFGNVSGALAVTEKGAIASLPTGERVEAVLKEMQCRANIDKRIGRNHDENRRAREAGEGERQ